MEVKSAPPVKVQPSNVPDRASEAAQARRAEQAAQAQRNEAKAQSTPPEPVKPVVNTQGQQTGRLLNVSA